MIRRCRMIKERGMVCYVGGGIGRRGDQGQST